MKRRARTSLVLGGMAGLLAAVVIAAPSGAAPRTRFPSRRASAQRLAGGALRAAARSTALRLSVGLAGSREPDSVALAAMADLDLGQLRRARRRLDWLAARGPGWGTSFAWDAFADGSVNPPSTVYSYTTATVGLAFADAARRLHDRRFHRIAERSAEVLASPALCCWRAGHAAGIWYSDSRTDHRHGYRVYNVTGLTLELLDRLGLRRRLGRSLERGLLAARGPDGWRYANGANRMNDLVHETFIVDGLEASGDRRIVRWELDRLWRSDTPGGFPSPTEATWGASDWGPASELRVLVGADECGRAGRLASALLGYRLGRLPARGRAFYAMGLAVFARACG